MNLDRRMMTKTRSPRRSNFLSCPLSDYVSEEPHKKCDVHLSIGPLIIQIHAAETELLAYLRILPGAQLI